MERILTISALAIAMLIPSAAFADNEYTAVKDTVPNPNPSYDETRYDEGVNMIEVKRVKPQPDYGPKPPLKPVREPEGPIYKEAEQMPQFPGGQSALISWLAKNIRYPERAMENDIQGRVVVEFVIEKDGSIGSVKVVKGVDRDLDREAIKVVKSMPKWQPGKNDGQPVRCYCTFPVTFKFQH